MKRGLALIVGALLGAAVCRPALGQAVTPVLPTAGPTATPPAYPAPIPLLHRSAKVSRHIASYHMEETAVISTGTTIALHAVASGDVSLKRHVERLTVIGSAGNMTQRIELIEIKHRAWLKSASTGNVWKRVKLAKVRSIEGLINDPLQEPSATPWNVPGWTNLGPTEMQGRMMWHLHDAPPQAPLTFDMFIGQRDYRLYSSWYSVVASASGTANDREDYSRYGKRVTVTPPRVGTSSP